MKAIKIIGALVACTSYAAIAQAQTIQPTVSARAATPPQDASSPTATDQAEPPQAASKVEDIIVTGSRTVRDGSQAPTPVTAVTTAALATTAPTSIADALNKLPQFSGSNSQFSVGTLNASASPAGNFLNLRGLGSQRVLVLVDGHRVPPTSNTNSVDVNVLPQMLVQRVDVVTGGASAIYGSDAVSGVVNYVIDDHMKGLKLLGQTGISSYGDGASYRLGAAFGTKIGDRLHVIASYERFQSDGLPSIYDRPWTLPSGTLVGAGTAASPYEVVANAQRNNLTNGGLVLAGPLGGQRFLPNGSLTPFNAGTPTQSSLYNVGSDGGIWADPANGGPSLASSLKTDQAFGRATFDISDTTKLSVTGIYARSNTAFNGAPSNSAYGSAGAARQITIYSDNPYLRPEVLARLGATPSFSVGRIYNDVPTIKQRSVNDYVSGSASLDGSLGGSWRWGLNYVYGKSIQNVDWNEFSSRNYFAALDAVRDPATGNIVCGVTLRNPSLLPGCVPVNILGTGNITPAAFNFMRQDSTYRIENVMQYATADLRGDLLNLPAGPVRFAGTLEWRRQELNQTSNSDPAIWSGSGGGVARTAYFAGIRGVPASALIFTSINVGLGRGTQTVKEASGELFVPIFKNAPVAEAFDLNLAARVTDYATSGSVVSWKVGGSWTPVDGIRIRANQSRDIAAPSLYSLFAGQNLSIGTFADPLTGQSVVVPTSTSGNPNLRPEFADTTTVGIVFKPHFLPNLTVTIDAYRINIKGAIQTQSAADQLATCAASSGTSAVCALISRPFPYSNATAANVPTLIQVQPQNLANLSTKGIDLDVNYSVPLNIFTSTGGTLTLRGFLNYLNSYKTQASGVAPVIELAGYTASIRDAAPPAIGLPRFKGLLTETVTQDNVSLAFSQRFTGSYTYGFPTQQFVSTIKLPNQTYFDLNATVNVGRDNRQQLFFNIQNLFNTSPPNIGTVLAQGLDVATDRSAYDVLGRYFTVGARLAF